MTRALCLNTAVAVLCLLLLPGDPAAAQTLNDPPGAEASPQALPEVVVTATRLPAIVADTPGVRSIDQATMTQRGAVFAADILTDVPGLSVYRAGPAGVTAVRIRGISQDKTLVLIDGVPVNDPSQPSGGFDFAGLDLGDVERIEVLSGPQSSLWGSDAIGGVIALVSREMHGVAGAWEMGSLETQRARLAAGVADEQSAFGLAWSTYDTDGISAAANGTEVDGVQAETFSLNARQALGGGFQLDGRLRQSDVFADIDGFGPVDTLDTSDTRNRSGFLRLSATGLFGLDQQLMLAGSDIERETVSAFASIYQGRHQLWRWQATRPEGANISYAFGLEHEVVRADLNGNRARQGAVSAFGALNWRPSERLNVAVGLRHDETDDFGGETTGRVSAAYRLEGGVILSGAWGSGFKTPTVSQAVCDFCFILPGTTVHALVPERAVGRELAIGWQSTDGRFQGRLTAYRLRVKDQIDGYFDPGSFEFYYVNTRRTRSQGLELEGQMVLARGFDLKLSHAWTDAVDEATGAAVLRVPRQAGSATLGWQGQRLSGALTVRTESDMPDSAGTRDGFTVAHVSAAYDLNARVTLTGRIGNLTDRRYQQLLGYGEPGRTAYLGIRLRY